MYNRVEWDIQSRLTHSMDNNIFWKYLFKNVPTKYTIKRNKQNVTV